MPLILPDPPSKATKTPSVFRQTAAQLAASSGQPYLHIGRGRFLSLSDAVTQTGTERSAEMIRDPLSLLTWPLYPYVGQALLLLIVRHLAPHVLTETQRQRLNAEEPLIPQLLNFPAADQQPALNAARALAADLQRSTQEADGLPGQILTTPRPPEDILLLLHTASTGFAALRIAERRPLSAAHVRHDTATLILTPNAIIDA